LSVDELGILKRKTNLGRLACPRLTRFTLAARTIFQDVTIHEPIAILIDVVVAAIFEAVALGAIPAIGVHVGIRVVAIRTSRDADAGFA
jgi:hypothetical protein